LGKMVRSVRASQVGERGWWAASDRLRWTSRRGPKSHRTPRPSAAGRAIGTGRGSATPRAPRAGWACSTARHRSAAVKADQTEADRPRLLRPGGSQAVRPGRRAPSASGVTGDADRLPLPPRRRGPDTQREALLESDIEEPAARPAAGVDMQQEQGAQDFFRSLYGGERQFQQQRQLQRDAEKAARRGQAGAIVGQIAGMALPNIPWGGTRRNAQQAPSPYSTSYIPPDERYGNRG
jgi:hypothetical protein